MSFTACAKQFFFVLKFLKALKFYVNRVISRNFQSPYIYTFGICLFFCCGPFFGVVAMVTCHGKARLFSLHILCFFFLMKNKSWSSPVGLELASLLPASIACCPPLDPLSSRFNFNFFSPVACEISNFRTYRYFLVLLTAP